MKKEGRYSEFLLQKQYLLFLFVIGLTWLVLFTPWEFRYTGWDTHDFAFVNFLYFSDSLKQGIIPFWNPFHLSGTDFANIGNIGLFSPYPLLFVLLSWVINPLYAYEILIQVTVLIGGIGAYVLFRTLPVQRLIALFGATVYVAAVLVPLVGQVVFIFSLSSLPWLIFACIKIAKSSSLRPLTSLTVATLWVFFAAYGYLWMNLINLLIAGLFSVCMYISMRASRFNEDKKALRNSMVNVMLFLGSAGMMYAFLMLPGYLSMKFYYGIFHGDYISPEPRLRSLGALASYSYNGIYYAIMAMLDPWIFVNNKSLFSEVLIWFQGIGLVSCILFFVAPWKKLSWQTLFSLVMMGIALLYSSANSNFIGKVIRIIPIINANRWWMVGLCYAAFFLLLSTLPRVALIKKGFINQKYFVLKLIGFSGLLLILLLYYQSPGYKYLLLFLSTSLILFLGLVRNEIVWSGALISLMIINLLAFAMVFNGAPQTTSKVQNIKYAKQIRDRVQSVTITNNFRSMGTGHDYLFNDEQWILKKVPFSHGYDNVSNPLYWYLKNETFLSSFVTVTQNVRKLKNIVRDAYGSDNGFVQALMADVTEDPNRPLVEAAYYRNIPLKQNFSWKLDELKINPNDAFFKVNTNAQAYLLFNNLYFPGWQVYVNDKKAPMIKMNRIFQGVFLEGPGSYNVRFIFRPFVTKLAMALPYLVLILCLFSYFSSRRNSVKQ